MTKKVTMLTKFKNNFYYNGQTANHIIQESGKNPVWQWVFDDGSIGLLSSQGKEDVFTYISANGNVFEKATVKSKGKSLHGRTWETVKIFWNALGEELKTVNVQKYFHNGRLEENAEKVYHVNGPLSVRVDSFANRKTEFPKTQIAKNLHPAAMNKYEHIDGSTTYIEFYPNN